MHKQPAYLYNNIQSLYTDLVAISQGFRKVYARTLILYKGIDNQFALKLLNGDQRLIDAVGQTVHWQLLDRDTSELIYHTSKEVAGEYNSLVTFTITEGDLEKINSGHYVYSAYLVNSLGKRTILYGDSQYGASVAVEVIENAFPQVFPTVEITEFLASPAIPGVQPDNSFYTSAIDARPNVNSNNDALHTAMFYTSNFVGEIEIQASLENGSTDILEWAVVETIAFDGTESPKHENFNGVYSMIRFRYIPSVSNSGTVDKILYRS
jgi:hypothetical protein